MPSILGGSVRESGGGDVVPGTQQSARKDAGRTTPFVGVWLPIEQVVLEYRCRNLALLTAVPDLSTRARAGCTGFMCVLHRDMS